MAVSESFPTARYSTVARLARATLHELRGASSTIAIHLELLRAGLDDVVGAGMRDQLDRHIEVLQRESERLLRSAQAFFALLGLPDPEPVEFDVAALVAETGEALRPLAIERRVRLEVIRPSHPVRLTAVREHVRQALLDLASRALDDATQGSVVLVRLSSDAHGDVVTVGRADAEPAVLALGGRQA
jgi:hypothetical protein